nr:hypothetical protein [Tanacetum cinerariifolium]
MRNKSCASWDLGQTHMGRSGQGVGTVPGYPLVSVEVLRYDTKGEKVRIREKVPTEMELVLEQTQQGISYEVSVSAEGVEELKRKVKIKGEKKETSLHLGRNRVHTSTVNMDDPNITIEEYIMLEEEKARRRGKVYNWEITTYVSPFNDNKIDFRISFDESDDEDYIIFYDEYSFSYKIISVNNLKMDSENNDDKVNMPSFPSPAPKANDLDSFKDFEKEFLAIVYNDALKSKLDFLTKPAVSPQHIDEFNLKDKTSLSECDEKEQNILYFNDLLPFNIIYPDDLESDKDNDNDKTNIKQSLESNVINTYDGAYAQSPCKSLAKNHVVIVCDEKIVRIHYRNEILIDQGDKRDKGKKSMLSIISCLKTQKYMEKGCQVFLVKVTKKEIKDKSKDKRLEDVPVCEKWEGRYTVRIHEGMMEKNVVLWSAMVDAYCKLVEVGKARELFDEIPKRNVMTWTVMIDGYMKASCFEDGFGLFRKMRHENGIKVVSSTMTVVFKGCGRCDREKCGVDKGFNFFGLMPERNAVNAMVNAYCKLGDVGKVRELFDEIPKKNVMTWTAMIDGYTKASCFEDGFGLFRKMRRENEIKVVSSTMIVVFEGCGRCDRLSDLDSASKLFIVMEEKDNVSWNSLIGGYIQAKKIKEAYKHFNKLRMYLMIMLYKAINAVKAHTN